MKKTLNGAALVVALLAVAGCSAPSGADTSADDASMTVEATCKRLFGPDIEGPIADSVDIITRADQSADLSKIEPGEVAGTITALKSVATMAHPDLKADIEAQITPLQEFQTAMKDGATMTVDLTQRTESALRLIEKCTPHL